MVQLVSAPELSRRSVPSGGGGTPLLSPDAFGAGVGRAVSGAAGQAQSAVERYAAAYEADKRQLQQFNEQTAFAKLVAAERERLTRARQEVSGGAAGFTESFVKSHDETTKQFLDALPDDESKAKWGAQLASLRGGLAAEALGAEFTARNDYYKAEVDTQLGQLKTQIDKSPTAVEAFRVQGETIIASSGLAPKVKEQYLEWWQKDSALAYGAAKLREAPEALAATLGGGFFSRLRAQESGGDDAAKAGTSSASGRYQFIDSTWAQVVNSPEGQAAGLTLDGKNDPNQQDVGVRILTKQNATVLQKAGIDTDERNLYLAHFLGAQGAVKFSEQLSANPAAAAASVFPEAAAANRSVFFSPDGTPRTLSEVYDAQTRRFNAQPVSLEDDPVLARLGYEDKIKLRGAAERQSEEVARQSALTARAQYDQWWNDFQLRLFDGTAGKEDIEVARSTGQLTDAKDVQTAFSMVAKREKVIGDESAFVGKMSSPDAAWNPFSPKDKDLVNAGVKALGGTPEAAYSVWQRTGVLADAGATALRGGLVAQDPAKVQSAAQIASNMIASNPNAFAGVTGREELERAAFRYDYLVNGLGLTGQEAAQRIARENDPVARSKVSVTNEDALAFRKSFNTGAIATQVRAAFDPGFFTARPDAPLDPRQTAAMATDYAEAATEYYRTTGDAEGAKEFGTAQVKKLYGVSNGRLTKFPPERVYPASSDAKDPHGYIYRQAAEGIKAVTGRDVPAENVSLIPTRTTAEDWRNGRPAKYQVFYKYEEDGQTFFDVVAGKDFFADPDVETQRLKEDFAKRRASVVESRQSRTLAPNTDLPANALGSILQ